MASCVPKTPFDVMHDIANPLSPVERNALDFCIATAHSGQQITRAGICEAIGSDNHEGGTGPGVLNRLEAKGYISRTIYQRGVQVCITATGQCTAPPSNLATHWRLRTDRVPAPAIQAIRERAPNAVMEMEHDAKERGLTIQQHLMDLALVGHKVMRFEREEAGL